MSNVVVVYYYNPNSIKYLAVYIPRHLVADKSVL
jgi:hypothetical protein